MRPTDRHDEILSLLHRDGSRDLRVIDLTERLQATPTRSAVAILATGAFALAAGPAAVVAIAAMALVATGRRDVALRRLRWVLDAASRADVLLGPSRCDGLLEAASGDLLAATRALSKATGCAKPDLVRSAIETPVSHASRA